MTHLATEIQVISSHPLLIRAVEKTITHAKNLPVNLLPPLLSASQTPSEPSSERVFLLDACSLQTDLGPLAARCRAHSPGSKFLALLPGNATLTEKIRLFYWGIDGFVGLTESWQTELPKAIQSILKGQPWVPSEVLQAFVKHAKELLNAQLIHGHFLTAREGQILQLLMRRLTNKEISKSLGISERTVKFHVSNILSKLQLDDRRRLSPENLALKALASGA